MRKNRDLVKFGKTIRRLRQNKGLSQKALAAKSSLSANYIGTLERGCQNPSLKTLEKVAKGLGCSMADTCKGIK
jgi:transcriptional regulator with XRE-family HTH domain